MADRPRTISVSASATITAPPDVVELGFSIQGRNRAVDVAYAKTDEATKYVIDALHKLGVVDKMISTSSVSLDTIYEKEYDRSSGVREYMCTRSYTVRLTRELFPVAEKCLLVVTKAGATNINNLSWSLSEQASEEIRLSATRLAVDKAVERATLMAEKLGATLGSVRNINDGDKRGSGHRYDYSSERAMASGAMAMSQAVRKAPDVSTLPEGTASATAHVSIEFDLVIRLREVKSSKVAEPSSKKIDYF